MRKLILFALIATTFASCKKENVLSKWHVIELPVNTNDWVAIPNQNNVNCYTVNFNVPELKQNVFQDGLVVCYQYYDGRQINLPSVRHYQDGEFFWTQTIDYEYYVGGVQIFLTNSDFYYDEKPGNMLFVLQILY